MSIAACSLLLGGIGQASADTISVYVGYADGLRGSPFFPSIWDGSPNTVFEGVCDSGEDAGAVRIDNNGAVAITISNVTVSMPWAGPSFSLWGTHVLAPGEHLVLTETAHYNFDTSDVAISQPNGVPLPDGETAHASHVDFKVDGSPVTALLDTGHILTTGGYDFAFDGSNESQQWRLIGTTGVTDPSGAGSVPEPNPTCPLGPWAGLLELPATLGRLSRKVEIRLRPRRPSTGGISDLLRSNGR